MLNLKARKALVGSVRSSAMPGRGNFRARALEIMLHIRCTNPVQEQDAFQVFLDCMRHVIRLQ